MLDIITDVLKMVSTGSDAKQCVHGYQRAGLIFREPLCISCYAHKKQQLLSSEY
jgi:hypothetical protein